MSYASKQSGIKVSNEVGNDLITELGSTFPADTDTALVSGTEYIIAGQPVTSGIWGVQVAFDLTGDNTTAFTSVLIRVSTENAGGTQTDYNILINTTFPDDGVYSFTYNSFVDIGTTTPTDDPSPIYATILPTFVGTAPTSPSHYLRLFKLV